MVLIYNSPLLFCPKSSWLMLLVNDFPVSLSGLWILTFPTIVRIRVIYIHKGPPAHPARWCGCQEPQTELIPRAVCPRQGDPRTDVFDSNDRPYWVRQYFGGAGSNCGLGQGTAWAGAGGSWVRPKTARVILYDLSFPNMLFWG